MRIKLQNDFVHIELMEAPIEARIYGPGVMFGRTTEDSAYPRYTYVFFLCSTIEHKCGGLQPKTCLVRTGDVIATCSIDPEDFAQERT